MNDSYTGIHAGSAGPCCGYLPVQWSFRYHSGIRIPLGTDSASKQFLEVPAFESSAINFHGIDSVHDSLCNKSKPRACNIRTNLVFARTWQWGYWYFLITLTTTPWIFTLDGSRMIGSSVSLAG
jgi:hypothetical protein